MSPMEKSTVSKPAETKMSGKPLNVWMIISLVLLIVLAGVIAAALPKFMGGKNAVSTKTASGTVLSFVNEIYGAQLGTVTAKGDATTEENGLYKITLVITKDGAPVEESVYVTKDGKTFIPSGAMIDIAKMREDYKSFQAQQQAAPTGDVNVNADVNANVNADQPASTGAAE